MLDELLITYKLTYYFMNGDTLAFTGSRNTLNREAEQWLARKKSGESNLVQMFPNGGSQIYDVSMAYKVTVTLE